MDQHPTARAAPAGPADEISVTHTRTGSTVDQRTHRMTVRVYDWCPEYGAHTDPELRSAYAERGI